MVLACVLSIVSCVNTTRRAPRSGRSDSRARARRRSTLRAPTLTWSDAGGRAEASGDSFVRLRSTMAQDATNDREEAPAMPIPGTCSPPLDVRYRREKLSQTGCVDPQIPPSSPPSHSYEVNSPLWSDNAAKTRGMAVPAGKTIHVKDCAQNPTECGASRIPAKGCFPSARDGEEFFSSTTSSSRHGCSRISTNRRVGYGYRWDVAQTDAILVPDERSPSCSTPASEWSCGPSHRGRLHILPFPKQDPPWGLKRRRLGRSTAKPDRPTAASDGSLRRIPKP